MAAQCPPNCNVCKDDAESLINESKNKLARKWDFFHYSNPAITVGAGLAVQINIPALADSYMVVKKLLARSTGAFTVIFLNTATGRVLQSAAVANVNVFGGPILAGMENLPAILRDPIILAPSSNLQAIVTDTSGAPNRIQLSFSGWKHYDLAHPPVNGKAGSRLEWFQHVVNATLVAAGRADTQVRIDADADFLVRKIIRTTADTFNMLISDSSSRDAWFDNYQEDSSVAGNAAFPFWLPKPKLVRANSSISVSLQNVGGVGGAIQLVLEGAKVYR